MYSRSDRGRKRVERGVLSTFAAVLVAFAGVPSSPHAAPSTVRSARLRVCADPNNLPFSNTKEEGFENAIARLIARDLGDTLEYYWWPQRRAWVRHTIGEGKCDVAIGVPASFDQLETTRPYYRSRYVFVSRADRHYDLQSLDDPRLRTLRIGLHFIGTEYSNPPAGHALGARGIVKNIVGYSIYGNFKDPNPPARLIDAVARGDVDLAIAWGTLVEYFAAREPARLAVSPLPAVDPRTGLRFEFPIAVGVRKGDIALRNDIQRVLDRRGNAVDEILAHYNIIKSGSGRAGRVAAEGER